MRQHRLDALIVLSALGVAIAAYLTFVAFDQNAEAFCSGVGDCHRVQDSQYARVGGIPVAALGLAMYAALLGLAVARRTARIPAPISARLLRTWTFTIAFAGMLYSVYLTYLELFVIDAICEWCVTSAVLVTIIAGLALPDVRPSAGHAAP